MTQRLKMAHTFHRIFYRFPIQNISRAKIHFHMKTVPDHSFDDFQLHRSHQLQMDLLKLLQPYHMQLGIFLFQKTQIFQQKMDITALLRQHRVGQYRLQKRLLHTFFRSQCLSRPCMGKSFNRTNAAGLCLFRQDKFAAGIDSDLIRFFFPDLLLCDFLSVLPQSSRIAEHGFHLQAASRNFHMRQTIALLIPGNLKHPGTELFGPLLSADTGNDSLQQLPHTFSLQR